MRLGGRVRVVGGSLVHRRMTAQWQKVSSLPPGGGRELRNMLRLLVVEIAGGDRSDERDPGLAGEDERLHRGIL